MRLQEPYHHQEDNELLLRLDWLVPVVALVLPLIPGVTPVLLVPLVMPDVLSVVLLLVSETRPDVPHEFEAPPAIVEPRLTRS